MSGKRALAALASLLLVGACNGVSDRDADGSPSPARLGATVGAATDPSSQASPAGSPGVLPSGSASAGPPFVIADWQPWPAAHPGEPAVLHDRGPRVNEVALTIDDGNDPETCRREFDFLRANHVEATFFPTWVGVVRDKDLWREIAAAGYPIGNHTITHRNLTESGIADHSIRRQLGGAQTRIEAIIGRTMLPVFRPTYGAVDLRVLAIAGELGLHTAVNWNTSAGDSGPNSKPEGMIRSATQGGRGSIILMHCNHSVSADILPAIVQSYLERGFRFVTIPELLRRGDGTPDGSCPDVSPPPVSPLPSDVPILPTTLPCDSSEPDASDGSPGGPTIAPDPGASPLSE